MLYGVLVGIGLYAAGISITAVTFQYFPDWWVGASPGLTPQEQSNHSWNLIVTYCMIMNKSAHVLLLAAPTLYCGGKLYELYFPKKVLNGVVSPMKDMSTESTNTTNTYINSIIENVDVSTMELASFIGQFPF